MDKKKQQGAPTKYKPEFDKQAYKLCLLGAIDKELADFFEVDVRTIDNWKKDFPSFFQSIKQGKLIADANVAESLYKLASGHTVKEVTYEKIDCDINPESDDADEEIGAIWRKKVVVKEVSPNATAGIFWSKNRQPKKWKDKQEVEHSGEMALDIKPIKWVEEEESDKDAKHNK